MKKQFLLSAVLCLSLTAFGQKVHQLASPSGNIRISVELTDQIQYDCLLYTSPSPRDA